MADNRMYLRCDGCGAEIFIAKRYDGYYTIHPDLAKRLDDFFDKHDDCAFRNGGDKMGRDNYSLKYESPREWGEV